MATAATKKGKKAAEKASKSFAVQYLEDLIFEMMLNTGQGAKSREIAGELEETVKLHPKFVRKTLYYSDRFDMEDRRWNLALRTAIERTFEGSIEYTLSCYGKPMSLGALQNEMALVQRRPVDFFDGLLLGTLHGRSRKYMELPDGRWQLREWQLDVTETDPERCFLRNFFLEQEEVRPLVEELLDTRMSGDQPAAEIAVKLVRKVGRPVPHKVLSYAVWRLRDGDLEPATFLQECEAEPRLLGLSGPMWGLQEYVESYHRELKRLSRRAETEEGAEWVEEEEPEGPIVITPTDLEEIYKYLRRRKKPQPTSALVEAVFDYSSSSRRFQESVDALLGAMSLDTRFVRTGRQTWALPDMMPKHTDRVPEALIPVPAADGDEVDAELDDEGLEAALVSWVHDPRYEDFGEEPEIDISPEQQPTDELRYILLYDHWKAGTLKVRVCDRRFYPAESDLVCANFVDEETGKSYPVWLSYTTSLLYELGDWYKARKLEPGAVFRVALGSVPDEFLVSYADEIDPYVGLEAARIRGLTKVKQTANKEKWSVLAIMQHLAAEHEKGVPFMKLWAEVNVVRRTTRRLVASNLASYHCFHQRPANSDVWVFDERKVTQGRKKTKRKYLRR